ncbi:ubiquitin-conjugating enzyme [Plectosphaerella plurivora]|uniref:Ubiquitin-conjugating enzyme n=1 Tax=Plectosphaerella plurivora TaxID=936078 RepID=A0A9P8VAH1_9PEZI|nr:ubiquitin-conjugating enzyme [Plectosphaerella plurivora]
MANPTFNSKSPTIRRILKEAAELSNSPSPDYTAAPLESDLFEWHFTFRGPPNSPYATGIYHGRIVLPPTYPLRPPSFRFSTASGRFEVNREICLSISGHHEETWQPAWGIRTALVALRSFMETDPRGQLGGLEATDGIRERHATASHSYRCPACAKTNVEILQESAELAKASEAAAADVEIPPELKLGWKDEMGKPAEGDPATSATTSSTPETAETARLAEGFVQTSVPPSEGLSGGTHAGQVEAPPARRELPAAAASALVQPTPEAANAQLGHIPIGADDGVPVWVDRAIVIVVVILIAMIAKALLEE